MTNEFNGVVVDRSALVVGGGTMGAGIAQSLLLAGVHVTLTEISEEASNASITKIVNNLERFGGLKYAANLFGSVGIPEEAPVDIAIEAIHEDVKLKQSLLSTIEAAVRPDTVIASNTSSLSINELGSALKDPGRFLGMHFFNPVPRSLLVEIVTGDSLREEVLGQAQNWVTLLEKEAIVVRDSPGFATSRLGICIGLEAMRMLEENVASAEDIDRAMVLGYKFPIGPLRLTDLVGLDVRLAVSEHLHSAIGERFKAPDVLRNKVAAGELGKKTGKGFFDW